MGDNWDDDDFEPEVSSLAPPPPVEETPAPAQQATGPKPEKKKNEINMESLGRELTAAEREEMQKRQDLALAREMFGGTDADGETVGYEDILTKEEFEQWGAKVGSFLATRHKAAHYGDLINKLILSVADKLDAAEIRKISNHLKALADSKKDEKPKTGPTGGAKKKKAQLKANKGAAGMYDDFGGGRGGKSYDDFDDEDFM